MNTNSRNIFNKVKIAVLIAIPIILLLLPANFFDSGDSICISQRLLGLECPGCGITRAIQHFIHGNFAIAWQFNKLVVLVAPLLITLWLKELLACFNIRILNWL